MTELTYHFRQRLALELGEAVVHDLRNAVFHQLHRMPMTFFVRTKLGSVISRMTSDIEAVRRGVQEVFFVSIVNGGQMLFSGALMWYCDPGLFAVILFMVPFLWAVYRFFRTRLSKAAREVQESFSRVTASVAESVNGIRVTQGFSREEVNSQLFHQLVQDHSRYNMNITASSTLYGQVLDFNTQLFTAILLIVGGYRVLSTGVHLPIGEMIQFLFLSNLFFAPLQTVANQYNNALMSMAGAERVFKLLDREPDWQDAPEARDFTIEKGRVEFRHVNFAYDTGRPILHDINFVADTGTSTALVGSTGSGKSTILNLLAKFYVTHDGSITIDGIDISQIRAESIHRQLGLVQQQNFLFTGTVLDNIRFGKPGATREEVVASLQRLDCLDMIEALPESLDTRVYERGNGLSVGQRQIICFARALLVDPRILMLDEATSSIDALTEVRLQHALSVLLKGRTSFIVAHRLSTIRQADQLLVIGHGRIEERGNHRELLARNGAYATLYRQFIQLRQST